MSHNNILISGAAIDLSSLIVVEGKVCWDLYIDRLVVSLDGNLLDALAASIKVTFEWDPSHFANLLVEKCHLFPHRQLSVDLVWKRLEIQ